MTTHLSDTQIQDYSDGTLNGAPREEAGSHLAGCAPCRSRADEVARLLAGLQALPRTSEPSSGVRVRVIRATTSRFPRLLKQALAAAALLGLGFMGGKWSSVTSGSPGNVDDAREPALAVQQSGTAYVKALALLASDGSSVEADVAAQGREAALASLYAAAAELTRLLPSDPDALGILRAAGAARQRAIGPELPASVHF